MSEAIEPAVDSVLVIAVRRRRKRTSFLIGMLEWATIIVGVLTLAACCGRLWWILELTCHFRVQYLAFLAVGAAVFLLVGRWRAAAAAVFLAALNLVPILPLYIGGSTVRAEGEAVRALLWNVNTANTSHADVIEYIRESAPDFVVLLELDGEWIGVLDRGLSDYPHRCSRGRSDNFGLGLYSRYPIESGGIVSIGVAEVPSVEVRIDIDGQLLTVIGTHPPPPKNPEYVHGRDSQLAELARLTAGMEGPRVVLGDLNATPWCPVFMDLLRDSGLRDARRGFGLHPTWPAIMPLLGIPIDHVLVSDGVEVRDFSVGPSHGSDHHAVVVDLVLPAADD